MRRLTATAKHTQKDKREGRTRDQIRAHLLSAWLRGVGTDTAVRTKLFVTVPVQLLAGDPVPVVFRLFRLRRLRSTTGGARARAQ